MKQFLQNKAQYLGPLLFLLTLALPSQLETNQKHFLAIFFLVVANWLFSSIPLYITGLIGVSLTVFFQILPADKALAHFADPIIFLFMGGFLFAKAMNQTMLDKRLSLQLLSQPFIKGSFKRMLFALYAATTFLSMWVSNTATTAMMLPIIIGIMDSLKIRDTKLIGLILLGVAYSSSIGGLGTPIASTANVIAIGLLNDLANIQIGFLQ